MRRRYAPFYAVARATALAGARFADVGTLTSTSHRDTRESLMPNLFLQLSSDDGSTPVSTQPLAEGPALLMLQTASFAGVELVPWGSNYTFAVALAAPDESTHLAIYKPRAGEAPLWDFPEGTLYKREVAAYLLSRQLGWDLVPPTVVREGPHGVGSLQLYVQPMEDDAETARFWRGTDPQIEKMVLFDHITNNADRKIGHCLRDATGKVWGIDQGLTFNIEPKLRTVLWQYRGEPIAEPLKEDLAAMLDVAPVVHQQLAPYLEPQEIDIMLERARRLLDHGAYPMLDPRRNVPYGWW